MSEAQVTHGRTLVNCRRVEHGARSGGVAEDWAAVATAINERMTERRLSQREVSERAGVSQSTIRELQHGRSDRKRTNTTLAKVAHALDWPPHHLVDIARGVSDTPAATVPEPTGGEGGAVMTELRAIRAQLAQIDARLSKITGDAE